MSTHPMQIPGIQDQLQKRVCSLIFTPQSVGAYYSAFSPSLFYSTSAVPYTRETGCSECLTVKLWVMALMEHGAVSGFGLHGTNFRTLWLLLGTGTGAKDLLAAVCLSSEDL